MEATEDQLRQYSDVRCWLAHVYKFALAERKGFNPAQLDGLQYEIPSSVYSSYIDIWHIWLTTFILKFNQQGWSVRAVDFTTSPLPKLPDYVLIGLSKHSIFENKPFTDYAKDLKLTSGEKKVLKELAARIS